LRRESRLKIDVKRSFMIFDNMYLFDNKDKRNIRFDWAMKYLLRNKANYVVLEGFLSELFKENVVIKNIVDIKRNQEYPENIFNRVVIKVENEKGEIFIIEMQNINEADYIFRKLHGVSRASIEYIEYIELGKDYKNASKIYAINIVYFKMGQGKDYVYNGGDNEFRGIHENDLLQLPLKQREYFRYEAINQLSPEYYIIKVNDFDDIVKDTLDEWIYYLKNNIIREDFTAKGLPEAREILQIDLLSEKERKAYVYHIDRVLFENGAIKDAKDEGFAEGFAKSEKLTEELEKEQEPEKEQGWIETVVLNCVRAGIPSETIHTITGLSGDVVQTIIANNKL
jgi:predicted transposase/invertase (TIGR01784 family)